MHFLFGGWVSRVPWKWLGIWLGLALLLLPFAARPIVVPFQDYGRHLQNGQQILAGRWDVVRTNYYSSVVASYPVVNHHWLAGVAIALGEKMVGAVGVHLVHVGLLIAVLGWWCRRVKEEGASSWGVLVIGLGMTLLLATRTEVRPETLGYVGVAVWLWWLRRLERGAGLSLWAGVAALLFQALWVNSHVSFFMGPLLLGITVGAGWLTYYFPRLWGTSGVRVTQPTLRRATGLLGVLILVNFLNPNTWRGALQPLLIFRTYEYSIIENQTPFFLIQRLPEPIYYVWGVLVLLVGGCLALGWKRVGWIEAGRAVLGIAMSCMAMRNFPFFGLLSLPLLTVGLDMLQRRGMSWLNEEQREQTLSAFIISGLLLWSTVLFLVYSGIYKPTVQAAYMRVGYFPNQFGAAQFIREHKLYGATFSNYDIGSYLIQQTYPNLRPFTDNRPEAYPKGFFPEYVRMQEDEAVWQAALQRYQFEQIVFGHNDITPWANTFLSKRLADPEWSVVYADMYVVILLRHLPKNTEFIQKYKNTSVRMVPR